MKTEIRLKLCFLTAERANYFIPVLKLTEKIRIGGKIKKKYDEPTTPCDRLIKSTYVPQEDKEKLERRFKSMNLFTLKKMMDEKLKQFKAFSKHHGYE